MCADHSRIKATKYSKTITSQPGPDSILNRLWEWKSIINSSPQTRELNSKAIIQISLKSG